MDDPTRDEWQQPDWVLRVLELTPEMVVAEVDAGNGYFTVRIARAVPAGQVIATALEPDMVRFLADRAAREHLPNVRAALATVDDPGLRPESVDRILIVDAWHRVPDRVRLAQQLARALRPGGEIAIFEFTREAAHGPPRARRLLLDTVLADLREAGLVARPSPFEIPGQSIALGIRPGGVGAGTALGAACVPRDQPSWSGPALVVEAVGAHVTICMSPPSGEPVCLAVEPRTGAALGAAAPLVGRRWGPPPVVVPRSKDAIAIDGRTVVVCRAGACERLPEAVPADVGEPPRIAVNAAGTEVFVVGDDESGDLYDIHTHARLAHASFGWGAGPPPPANSREVAFVGSSILVGDFADAGTYDRIVDPRRGGYALLDKPWALLPDHLVVHFDGLGRIDLYDLDASHRTVVQRRAGRPHQPNEGVIGAIAVVGADAVVVTQDPPATYFVDGKAHTISGPRPLPSCPGARPGGRGGP